MLTGQMVTEYTIASTAQLVNANTRRLEDALLQEIGLTQAHFGRFVYPGEKIGGLDGGSTTNNRTWRCPRDSCCRA